LFADWSLVTSFLLIAGTGAFAHALASAAACDLRFEAAAFARLQIKSVLFGVGDNPFASDGALKAANSAFNTLVIMNLYSCHSIPPKIPNGFAMHPGGGGLIEAIIATLDSNGSGLVYRYDSMKNRIAFKPVSLPRQLNAVNALDRCAQSIHSRRKGHKPLYL
jgi:hypothetical protein